MDLKVIHMPGCTYVTGTDFFFFSIPESSLKLFFFYKICVSAVLTNRGKNEFY